MNVVRFDELIRWSEGEFVQRHAVPPLPDADVKDICASEQLSVKEFCNHFSRRIAHEYFAGNLTFRAADVAMNALEAFVMNTYKVRLPPYAWEVYLAFDEGEYSHPDDPKGTNSEEKYTKPAIESIVTGDRILDVR